MHVLSSDDRELGVIHQMLIDPARRVVTAVVVRQRAFPPHDVAVPVSAMQGEPTAGLHLTATAERVRALPGFEEHYYTTPLPDDETVGGRDSEANWTMAVMAELALLRPQNRDRDDAAQAEVDAIIRRQDRENAVIGVGSAVRGPDGQVVGDLRQLTFQIVSGRLMSLVVRMHAGHLYEEDVEVPATLITSVDDDTITLSVDRDWVTNWARVGTGHTVWTSDGQLLGTVTWRLPDGLEVADAARAHQVRVPIAAVARVDGDRVVLAVDGTQAAQWEQRPGDDAW
jgi:sporulation protein YlmC with PRC-barrel domain